MGFRAVQGPKLLQACVLACSVQQAPPGIIPQTIIYCLREGNAGGESASAFVKRGCTQKPNPTPLPLYSCTLSLAPGSPCAEDATKRSFSRKHKVKSCA